MFGVHKEKIGDVSVILCKGRMVGGDAAFKLEDEVRRQGDARVVLLDLSELVSLSGDVIGMLAVLQVWARGLGIQFKLFNPSRGVRQSLWRLRSTDEFEIASIDDVLSMLHWQGPRNGFIESVSQSPGLHDSCGGLVLCNAVPSAVPVPTPTAVPTPNVVLHCA